MVRFHSEVPLTLRKKMRKKKKNKYRNRFLIDGPIHTKVDGPKKGKKGYNRKNKDWKNE